MLTYILLLLFCLLPFRVHAETLSPQELEALCKEAEILYNQGVETYSKDQAQAMELWRKSANRYERVIQEGHLENGLLHYNLGNVHARLEEYGRALLCYRRAETFLPNDRAIQQNLRHVQRLCGVNADGSAANGLSLFERIPLTTRLWSFLSSFALLWILAIVCLFVKRRRLRQALVLPAIVALLAGVTLLPTFRREHSSTPEGLVIASEVIARQGHSESYEPAFTAPLREGTPFHVLQERNGWLEIRLNANDNPVCWIPATAGERLWAN